MTFNIFGEDIEQVKKEKEDYMNEKKLIKLLEEELRNAFESSNAAPYEQAAKDYETHCKETADRKYKEDEERYFKQWNKDVNQFNTVKRPKHYNSHPSGIECIQVAEHMNFNLGNAFKYIWRADEKGGIEDLEKAIMYLDFEIARRRRGMDQK